MTSVDVREAIDAVWRIESARLIAGLARVVRDVGVAEDLAQDALVAALERWPVTGVPDNPGAWLMAAAKNRAIDGFRREKLLEREQAMEQYYLLPAIRGDFLFKLGRFDGARTAFERAASLTRNSRERGLLMDRAAACPRG